MSYYPPTILELIRRIAKLPGIGEKTAERLALHLLRAPRAEVEHLARALLAVKEQTRVCGRCFGLSDAPVCRLCADPSRDSGQLCVVEQFTDMVAIEKAGAFRGRYHVLQGALAPMDGVGPENIRIRELLQRLADGLFEEVILGHQSNGVRRRHRRLPGPAACRPEAAYQPYRLRCADRGGPQVRGSGDTQARAGRPQCPLTPTICSSAGVAAPAAAATAAPT